MTPEEVAALKADRPHRDAVLLVVWQDITGDGGGWKKAKKLPKLTTCETVGWVVRWKPYLVIGASRGAKGKLAGDRTAIPWGCITDARWIG